MRIALLLLAALVFAGCAADDSGDDAATNSVTDPSTDPIVVDEGEGDAADPPEHGFCGPPQCDPCPSEHYLHVALIEQSQGAALAWEDIPADNQTDLLEGLLEDAAETGAGEFNGTADDVGREMDHLYDALVANGQPDPRDGDGSPVVELEYQGAFYSVSDAQMQC